MNTVDHDKPITIYINNLLLKIPYQFILYANTNKCDMEILRIHFHISVSRSRSRIARLVRICIWNFDFTARLPSRGMVLISTPTESALECLSLHTVVDTMYYQTSSSILSWMYEKSILFLFYVMPSILSIFRCLQNFF